MEGSTCQQKNDFCQLTTVTYIIQILATEWWAMFLLPIEVQNAALLGAVFIGPCWQLFSHSQPTGRSLGAFTYCVRLHANIIECQICSLLLFFVFTCMICYDAFDHHACLNLLCGTFRLGRSIYSRVFFRSSLVFFPARLGFWVSGFLGLWVCGPRASGVPGFWVSVCLGCFFRSPYTTPHLGPSALCVPDTKTVQFSAF